MGRRQLGRRREKSCAAESTQVRGRWGAVRPNAGLERCSEGEAAWSGGPAPNDSVAHYTTVVVESTTVNSALMSELLGGAARYKALRCLYEQPARAFGTRELAAAAGIDPANASRWLRR